MEQGPGPAEPGLEAWQRLLLPFMVGSLIVMGLLFFGLTLWNFRDLQGRLEYRTVDIQAVLEALQQDPVASKDPTYRDWYVRAVLEESTLKHRYRQNSAVIHARVWTRYMGFLTGMVLALSGCVFILGKLREQVNISAAAQGWTGTLVTSSPGLALALAGAVLVGISLYVPMTVETSDSPVYLPRQIEVSGAEGEGAKDRPPPAPVGPAAPPSGKRISSQQSAPPGLPADLLKKMQKEGGVPEAPKPPQKR